MNKSCSKICFKLSLGQILFKCIDHLSKNRFSSKLSKNGRFLLNKVKKIICDQNFFHKIKIAQNVGFPHRFSFSGQKVTPMGLPDASGPPLAFDNWSCHSDGHFDRTMGMTFSGHYEVVQAPCTRISHGGDKKSKLWLPIGVTVPCYRSLP